MQSFWLTCDAKAKAAFLKHTQHRNERRLAGPVARATHDNGPLTVILYFGDEGHMVEEAIAPQRTLGHGLPPWQNGLR